MFGVIALLHHIGRQDGGQKGQRKSIGDEGQPQSAWEGVCDDLPLGERGRQGSQEPKTLGIIRLSAVEVPPSLVVDKEQIDDKVFVVVD